MIDPPHESEFTAEGTLRVEIHFKQVEGSILWHKNDEVRGVHIMSSVEDIVRNILRHALSNTAFALGDSEIIEIDYEERV